jgi:peptide/nickel transport system ATP-binding protein
MNGATGLRAVPSPNKEVAVSVENLRVVVSQTKDPIVHGVSFDIGVGEIVGLVGESGSGKTTVALALCGYARRGLAIDSGKIVVAGRDLLKASPAELRELRGATISYVPQDPSSALNPAFAVGTQIREVLDAHKGSEGGSSEKRLREVLEEVQLPAELLGRYPHQLSGGQQQRIAIAMAFVCRPRVIVMDEPTTGLDVTTQRVILDTLYSMCRQYDVAGLYVSHDLAVVAGLASQVAVMYAGTVCELGTSQDIFDHASHHYTRALIRAIPSVDRSEVLETIPGRQSLADRRTDRCPFAARCPAVEQDCLTTLPTLDQTGSHQVRCFHPDIRGLDRRRLVVREPDTTSDEATNLLDVRSLCASYGDSAVLENVNFSIAPASCVALVGESGSGKTTLARCLVGLHNRWTGEIKFEGSPQSQNLRDRPRRSLEHLQYVFQNPYTALNPRKTVRQIIGYPLQQFYGKSADTKQRVLDALDEVGLAKRVADRYPHQLSGGERQRVAIARALIVEPSLVLCDEITSALDVSVQATIIELLRERQKARQLGLLFITHNLALVRSIAHYTMVLSNGHLIEVGPTEEILTRPKEPYTRHLLRDVPRMQPTYDEASVQ